MDLQMNISASNKKTKKKSQPDKNVNIKNKSSYSEYSFVSKPSIEGKIIAKKRKHPPDIKQKSNFSLLNTNNSDSNQIVTSIKENTKSNKKEKKNHDFSIERDGNKDSDMTINTKQKETSPQKADKAIKLKAEKGHEKKQYFEKKKSNDDDSKPEFKKRSIHSQITALFRNNPEIPRIGQRLVKPINEKVFSGRDFEDLNIHSFSIANLEKNMGLKQLTVVQQKASPVILQGRDVLVRSQTGSGKTLAYALPIVEALQALRPKLKRQDGVKALVVVPTRELALQTYELFVKLVYPFTWIVPGYLIGGEKRKAEKARIRKGFNILIGTPGRLCDHLEHTASLKLNGTRCLILDEADRLLDMGYEKDVSSIVKTLENHQAASKYDPMALIRENMKKHKRFGEDDNETSGNESKPTDEIMKDTEENTEAYKHELSNVFLSDKRQTVLLSATLTKAVETLAGLTMEDPVFIDASEGRATLIADSLAMAAPKEEVKDEPETAEIKQESDAEFEIVPQEQSDNDDEIENPSAGSGDESNDQEDSSDNDDDGEDGGESADGGDGDDKADSDNSEDDNNGTDDEEIDKSKLSVYKGLNAFKGMRDEKEESSTNKKDKKELKKKESEESNENKLESFKGLNPFGGVKMAKEEKKSSKKEKNKSGKDTDLPEQTTKAKDKKSKKAKRNTDESDTDSDYDFFAVAKVDKVLDASKKSPSKKRLADEEVSTHFVTESGEHSNPFQNALQNALAQDEMVIPSSVTQVYIVAPMKLRLVTLSALIVERCVRPGNGKMLVFMATQDLIDYHCELLSRILAGRKPSKISVEPKQIKGKSKEKNAWKNKIYGDASDENNSENEDEIKVKTESENFDVEESDKTEETVRKKEKKALKKEKDIKAEVKDEESGDEYEYKYDGMDLEEYEAKIRAENAFVNVEFFQLHGSMDQKTRTEVFKTFRKATSGVLLCTDVAARGLDLPHVDCIVQYTGPISVTDYVHRVGRTARAGNVGTAILMLLPSEVEFIRQLEARRIRINQEDMGISHRALVTGKDPRINRMDKTLAVQTCAAELQQTFEELVEKDRSLYIKGCKAFTSWLRFYSTYPREARAAFDRGALHMGHAARALAISETPKKIAREAPKHINRKESDLKRRAAKSDSKPAPGLSKAATARAANREKRMLLGEFESGLEPPKKKSKAS